MAPSVSLHELASHQNWAPTSSRIGRRANIYDLSSGLLCRIRDSIPNSHLFTHLAFSATCTTIRALYDDNKLWFRICRAYGLGINLGCPLGHLTWRELAVKHANHVANCSNERNCIHFLSYKFVPVELCNPFLPPLLFTWGLSLYHSRTAEDNLPLTAEQVEKYNIPSHAFRAVVAFDFSGPTLYNANTESILLSNLGTCLAEHSPASRMLATDPPMNEIKIESFSMYHTVTNEGGVLVCDVLNAVQTMMIANQVDLKHFVYLYDCYGGFPPGLQRLSGLCTKSLADLGRWLHDESAKLRQHGDAKWERMDALIRSLGWIDTVLEQTSIVDGLIFFYSDFGAIDAPSPPLIRVLKEHSYVLQSFLGFDSEEEYMKYWNIAPFLKNAFFGGLRQKMHGSNVFEAIWHFPNEHNGYDLLHRLLS